MLSEKIVATDTDHSQDWIWSKWLKVRRSARFVYEQFTHLEFVEDETRRSEIESDLAKLLYDYHTRSPVSTDLLIKLRYPRLASVINKSIDQRPSDHNTRVGNFGEILACEFAIQRGFDIPVFRLRYTPNINQSMKGDDILGFQYAENNEGKSIVLVGEAKYREHFSGNAVKTAYMDLEQKSRSYPLSMHFVATILDSQGNKPKAASIRQIRKGLASHDRLITQEHLLFLATGNEPQNPFECIKEKYAEKPLFNLIAINVIFKSGLEEWLKNIYEKEIWL